MIRFLSATPSHRRAAKELLAAQLREHRISVGKNAIGRVVDGAIKNRRLGAVLLAAVDGKATGVCYLAYTWTMEHGGKSAWLEEFYVLPKNRGKGIGQGLLDASLERARQDGCRAVDLEVEASHRKVEMLYRRNGFKPHRRNRWVKTLNGESIDG